jgi:hypothetical protein
MKKFSWLLVAFLMLALTSSAIAQDDEEDYEYEYVKDFMEAAIYGGLAVPTGGLADWTATHPATGTEELGTKTGVSFGVDVGHFLTMNLVVGLNLTYSHFGIESDTAAVQTLNHRLISPAAYLKYYFIGESNLMPYVKLHAGIDIPKYTTRIGGIDVASGPGRYRELSYSPAFAFGFGGGLFYYTHDYGGLYLEANYHMGLTEESEKEYSTSKFVFGENVSVLDVHAGITVFFGSD